MPCRFNTRASIGALGEQATVDWLLSNNYVILKRNYRSRFGEIDIIAQKKEIIAFVEVKYRLSRHFNLSSVITKTKQEKIIKTALVYLAQNNTVPGVYRFDVALVENENQKPHITYIEHAYTTQDIFSSRI